MATKSNTSKTKQIRGPRDLNDVLPPIDTRHVHVQCSLDFELLAAQQGWSPESQLGLLDRFLTQKNLWPDFLAHAERIARGENSSDCASASASATGHGCEVCGNLTFSHGECLKCGMEQGADDSDEVEAWPPDFWALVAQADAAAKEAKAQKRPKNLRFQRRKRRAAARVVKRAAKAAAKGKARAA